MNHLVISRRVSLLIACADHIARSGGIDPVRQATELAESWSRARPESFRELAVLAGMRPVPPEVHGLFLEALLGRAERARTR